MIKIKIVNEKAITPKKAYMGDAGFDVYSLEDKTLYPLERYKFRLGFCVEFPENYVLMICDKSGLAVNYGLSTIANIIDSTYRGEIHVVMINLSENIVEIKQGQKIAQMLLLPCYTGQEIFEIENLSSSSRGSGGFGSTGAY